MLIVAKRCKLLQIMLSHSNNLSNDAYDVIALFAQSLAVKTEILPDTTLAANQKP